MLYSPRTRARLAGAALLLFFLCPSVAAAQDDEGLSGSDIAIGVSINLCVTGPLVTTTGSNFAVKKRERQLRDEIQLFKQLTHMDKFLRENEPAIRQALALGAGDALEDLLYIISAEPVSHAQRMELRRRRHELTRVLDAPEDPAAPMARTSALRAMLAEVILTTDTRRASR